MPLWLLIGRRDAIGVGRPTQKVQSQNPALFRQIASQSLPWRRVAIVECRSAMIAVLSAADNHSAKCAVIPRSDFVQEARHPTHSTFFRLFGRHRADRILKKIDSVFG